MDNLHRTITIITADNLNNEVFYKFLGMTKEEATIMADRILNTSTPATLSDSDYLGDPIVSVVGFIDVTNLKSSHAR